MNQSHCKGSVTIVLCEEEEQQQPTGFVKYRSNYSSNTVVL